MVGRATPLERHGLDVRETLRQRRRLELALQAELRAGTEGAGIAAGRATELLGVQQPSVPRDQASDGVDLGVLDGGGQVDASRGQPEPAGGGDDRRP